MRTEASSIFNQDSSAPCHSLAASPPEKKEDEGNGREGKGKGWMNKIIHRLEHIDILRNPPLIKPGRTCAVTFVLFTFTLPTLLRS